MLFSAHSTLNPYLPSPSPSSASYCSHSQQQQQHYHAHHHAHRHPHLPRPYSSSSRPSTPSALSPPYHQSYSPFPPDDARTKKALSAPSSPYQKTCYSRHPVHSAYSSHHHLLHHSAAHYRMGLTGHHCHHRPSSHVGHHAFRGDRRPHAHRSRCDRCDDSRAAVAAAEEARRRAQQHLRACPCCFRLRGHAGWSTCGGRSGARLCRDGCGDRAHRRLLLRRRGPSVGGPVYRHCHREEERPGAVGLAWKAASVRGS